MTANRSSVERPSSTTSLQVAAGTGRKRGDTVPTDQHDAGGGARPNAGRSGRPGADTRGPGRKAGSRGEPSRNGTSRNVNATPKPPRAPKPPTRRHLLRQRLRTTLALIRANPTGRVTLKVAVAIAGALVVTIGIILIPLPGPGWLLVIAGMGIWAVEFHWAKRLLGFTRRHVQGWTRWATTRPLPMRFALGSVGLVFVATVAWLSLKYSLGIDVVAKALHYLATN
ncbi:TIGR02611 family protein [Micromonospora sp. NPDC000207]|uniref:TIGR02611 family protein n=1 Tax=Micromonospora sp. NPDC000207 TaxID=3154246 RepID=UPI003325D837